MTIADDRKPGWFFYLAWIVLSSISLPIAFAIYWALAHLANEVIGVTVQVGGQTHITEDFLVPYIVWPAFGLTFGFLQYLLLKRYLKRIKWWVPLTVVGWLLGLVAGNFLLSALAVGLDGRAIWAKALALALAGGAIGLAQWSLFHRQMRRSALWVLANLIAWGAFSWGAASLSNQAIILTGITLLVLGIVTGVALWLLLDWFPKRELRKRV